MNAAGTKNLLFSSFLISEGRGAWEEHTDQDKNALSLAFICSENPRQSGILLFANPSQILPIYQIIARSLSKILLQCRRLPRVRGHLANQKRHVETPKKRRKLSQISRCHKIKDGGYSNTKTNKQHSPTQNTSKLQVKILPKLNLMGNGKCAKYWNLNADTSVFLRSSLPFFASS